MVSSRHSARFLRSILISVVAIFLLLVTFIAHAFASTRQSRSDNGLLCFEPEGNLPVIQYSGQYFSNLTMHPAREGPRLCRWCDLCLLYHRSHVLESNGQRSLVLLHSLSLAPGFPLLTSVLSSWHVAGILL